MLNRDTVMTEVDTDDQLYYRNWIQQAIHQWLKDYGSGKWDADTLNKHAADLFSEAYNRISRDRQRDVLIARTIEMLKKKMEIT